MNDPTIENNRILSYRSDEEIPNEIKETLVNYSKENDLDTLFNVSAVRNKSGTYIGKGFIYTTPRNFSHFKNIIDGNGANPEDVFVVEDDIGFPVSFNVFTANVYEFGEDNSKNKLFCSSVPRNVTKEILEEHFKTFTTKKQIMTTKGETLTFPRISIREGQRFLRTATVSFEDSTEDAYYAFIMSRRLDIVGEDGVKTSLIFSPHVKQKRNNSNSNSNRGRGRGRGRNYRRR